MKRIVKCIKLLLGIYIVLAVIPLSHLIMEILIVGLGVIGSTYGYLFQKAGHNTEHFVRKDSPKYSVSELEIDLLDGREHAAGKWKKDTYQIRRAPEKKRYDFIFVSVPAGGIAGVLHSLKVQEIQGTIVLAYGIWGLIAGLPSRWRAGLYPGLPGGRRKYQQRNFKYLCL